MYDRAVIVPIFFLLLLPFASALEPIPNWQSSCFNATTLIKEADIYYNNTIYEFNQTVACPYGCDTYRNVCWKWPGQAIPGEYYMLFTVFGLVLLGAGIFRLDIKPKEIMPADLVFALMCMGLFFVLALQGNNVIDMTTGEAVQIPMLVWYSYGFAGLSVAIFIFNLFKLISREVEE